MLFELTLEQRYLNQQIINRWNYETSSVPAAVSLSLALVSAFGAIPTAGVYPANTPIAALRAFQDNAVEFVGISARDVYSTTDFYQTSFTPALTGNISGVSMGPVPAFGFISTRTRSDIRRATKRFVGVTNNNMGAADNTWAAATITFLNAMASEMGETLTFNDEGNTLSFAPVVVGKERYEIGDTGRFAYRYYPTMSAQNAHIMRSIAWSAYPTVRSQVSRQIGRGR